MQEIIVSANEAGKRLSKLLSTYLNTAPDSFIYKMLRKKNIKLNGGKADGREILKDGDVVKIFLSDETISKFRKNAGYDSTNRPLLKGRMSVEGIAELMAKREPKYMAAGTGRSNLMLYIRMTTSLLPTSLQGCCPRRQTMATTP